MYLSLIAFALVVVAFVVILDQVVASEHQKELAAIYRRDVEERSQESIAQHSFEARRKYLQSVQQGLIDQKNKSN